MPVIAVAAIPTVASFLLRMGITKTAKKYAPKLIKQARAYIKKNNLTKAKPTVGTKSTKKITVTKSKKVRPVNKKTQTKKTDKKTDKTKIKGPKIILK